MGWSCFHGALAAPKREVWKERVDPALLGWREEALPVVGPQGCARSCWHRGPRVPSQLQQEGSSV